MESPAINALSYVRASSSAPPNKDCREAPRNAWQAIRKGLRGRCPNCGEGKMFRSYLKVNDACPHCGEELFHQRADDAPPYMTIFVVGHIIGTFMILVEEYWPDAPDMAARHGLANHNPHPLALAFANHQGWSHRPSMGLADARFRDGRQKAN